MDYTYDFKDLADFYKSYDDLMKFWLKKFDKKIFNMVYENLVANKELETKKILKFVILNGMIIVLIFTKIKDLCLLRVWLK